MLAPSLWTWLGNSRNSVLSYDLQTYLRNPIYHFWTKKTGPKQLILHMERFHIVFSNYDFIKTKIVIFQAMILSTFLYASKAWILYWWYINHLECFQQMKLQRMGGPHHQQQGTLLNIFKAIINIASAGWVTCPECIPLDSHISSCLKNLPVARGYTETQNGTSSISWKRPWHRPTSTTKAGKPLLQTTFLP